MHGHDRLVDVADLGPGRGCRGEIRGTIDLEIAGKSQIRVGFRKGDILQTGRHKSVAILSAGYHIPALCVGIVVDPGTASGTVKRHRRGPVTATITIPGGIYGIQFPVILCTDTDRVTTGRAGIAMIDLVSVDAVTLRRPVISTIGAQPYSAVVHVPQLGSVVRADRHLMHIGMYLFPPVGLLCPVGSAVGGLPNVMGNEPEDIAIGKISANGHIVVALPGVVQHIVITGQVGHYRILHRAEVHAPIG